MQVHGIYAYWSSKYEIAQAHPGNALQLVVQPDQEIPLSGPRSHS